MRCGWGFVCLGELLQKRPVWGFASPGYELLVLRSRLSAASGACSTSPDPGVCVISSAARPEARGYPPFSGTRVELVSAGEKRLPGACGELGEVGRGSVTTQRRFRYRFALATKDCLTRLLYRLVQQGDAFRSIRAAAVMG